MPDLYRFMESFFQQIPARLLSGRKLRTGWLETDWFYVSFHRFSYMSNYSLGRHF